MKELELKHITCYLPYGLKLDLGGKSKNHNLFMISHFGSVFTICQGKKLHLTDISNKISLPDIKPILRPISDLKNKITYKGKTFVPLIELADIYHPYHHWYIDKGEVFCDDWNIDTGAYFMFDYGQFYLYENCGIGMKENVSQIELFDKLNEWLFDYRGLINSGLAVDVNTLEKNPYE